MKRLMLSMIVTAPLTACVSVNGDGLCAALRPLEATHADALQGPGVPDAVLISGAKLVAGIDAGCGR
jgi:hypothetical protein